jgi:hypothetical protein
MRHRTILSLAFILGLVPALNTAPLVAMQVQVQPPQVVPCDPKDSLVTVGEQTFAQDCTSDFFFGLEVTETPEVTETAVDEAPYRFYEFRFTGEPGNETGAYIPERFNSEAMVVSVLTGNFAFRVQGPGVIVDPQGQPLERYIASTPIGLGENPNDQLPNPMDSRVFGVAPPVEDFKCELNLPDGRTVCLLDPDEFTQENRQNIFVRLDPGDTVYLPANSTCFLCNTEQIGSTPAELLIWSSTTGFNGALESIANAMATPPAGTPTAQGSGRILSWMFNPGSSCK